VIGGPNGASKGGTGFPSHLTKAELAARRRVTPRTVERWMRNGCGPAYERRGRQALFALSKIEEWEAAGTFASLAAERAAEIQTKNGGPENNGLP
jgi:phage terminase Nu1 subunit (DNA packaging protein)